MSDSESKLQDLCRNLDQLTILQVDFLEEQLTLMLNLENHMMSGFIDLAKSRYISGERTVSTTQIPGEESEMRSKIKVIRDSGNKLEVAKCQDGDEPLKWFGVLVPTSLRQSQSHFQKVLELAVEIVNTRMEAERNKNEINALFETKNSVKKSIVV